MTTRRDGEGVDAMEELVVEEPVRGFLVELQRWATAAPEPSPELARLLATGLVTTAPRPRRLRMWEIILAKLSGLSLLAKAGVGVAVAATAVGGAGAAGVLPDPVQDAVAGVVERITPFEFPDSADEHAEFGGRVAEDAADPESPGVDGREIADEASDGRVPDQPGAPTELPDEADEGLERAGDTPASEHLPESIPPRQGDDDTDEGEPTDEGQPSEVPSDAGSEYRPSEVPSDAGSEYRPSEVPSEDEPTEVPSDAGSEYRP